MLLLLINYCFDAKVGLVCHVLKILLQNEAGKNFVMYLKQTNLESRLNISERLKEDFDDTVFQHLVADLKQQYFCVHVQYSGCYVIF